MGEVRLMRTEPLHCSIRPCWSLSMCDKNGLALSHPDYIQSAAPSSPSEENLFRPLTPFSLIW